MAGIMGIVAICSALLVGAATPSEIRVADAYARADDAAARWTIGTDAVEMGLECKAGKLRLTSFRNKLTNPTAEYVVANESSDLLSWSESNWRLEKSNVRQVVVGGRPAVQLDLTLCESSL